MIKNQQYISLSIATIFAFLFLVFFTYSGNAQTLYSCESPRGAPLLHTIDPNTGATLTTTPITLDGVQLRGCNGLAKDPSTGVCWIILTPPNSGGPGSEPGPRLLATLDPITGVASEIGNTGQAIAGIAFDRFGDTLYGLTGNADGGAIPTIFTLSKLDGSPTFFKELVGTDAGEAIGFNPNDGLIYRSTGFNDLNGTQNFGSINPNNKVFTKITLSGDTAEYREQLGLTHQSGNLFLSSQRIEPALHSVTTGGVVSFIGFMDHEAKGLAFDCGVADFTGIPTMSEWGLIVMAGVLGLLGLLAIRRKKAAL